MSVVKINALEIPPQAGDEIVKRFAARLESLADVAGFEGFELLRPTGETELRWFVYTRWADQASYDAWRDGDVSAQPKLGKLSEANDGDGARASHAAPEGEAPQQPVSMGATLLEFEVAVSADPSGV